MGAAGGRAAVCGAAASRESIVLESSGTEFEDVDVEGLLGESDSDCSGGEGVAGDRSADIMALREITDGAHEGCGRRRATAERHREVLSEEEEIGRAHV